MAAAEIRPANPAGHSEIPKLQSVYGMAVLLFGSLGGASAYLDGRLLPSVISSLMLGVACVFIPPDYLLWLLGAALSLNWIRALAAYLGMGYVGTHPERFAAREEDDVELRRLLLASIMVFPVICTAALAGAELYLGILKG